MPEEFMIQPGGFKNVSRDGQVVGFQLRVRSAYYRGVYLSLVEDFEITVDGETFPRDRIRFAIGEKSYTLDELAPITDQRWPFRQPATLTVLKPGGLKTGMHDVHLAQKLRVSYMPVQPSVYVSTKKMSLVV
ncbi:MAG TPA: DUF6379 domain-containing protein [Patescibacteria group bacterium]|nr:DUF6379 domain-containing protein [Patescibacteria group bacterium]